MVVLHRLFLKIVVSEVKKLTTAKKAHIMYTTKARISRSRKLPMHRENAGGASIRDGVFEGRL